MTGGGAIEMPLLIACMRESAGMGAREGEIDNDAKQIRN
jgi:hypothetical protein